jgi:hypothetical protein
MPSLGFEAMIPAFERAQTVHALDRAATAMASRVAYAPQITRALLGQ